jgi:tetratricopeptide (TPR) repeat protein
LFAFFLLLLFRLYQGQKRSKEAFPFYQKALEYTEITKDEKSLECVQVLRELAGVEQALGLYAAAISHFSRVRANGLATEAALNLMLFVNMRAVAALNMPGRHWPR